MAAGSGTASYPDAAGESIFEDAGKGVVGIALAIFGVEQFKSIDKAIAALAQGANYLAVRFVEFVVAELWWAAHLGTATSELAGYMDEAQASVNRLADSEAEAWRELLDVRLPADLQDLYDKIAGEIPKQHKINLAPIEAEIKKLQDEARAELTWQDKTAEPAIKAFDTFDGTWRKTYLPAARVLVKWLAHPGQLAEFALPAIIAGLPAALAKKPAKVPATGAEALLVATWANDPQVIWTAIQRWLVTGS